MAFWHRIFICFVSAALAIMLQGCGGCDKDEGSKCLSVTGGCQPYSKCFKDANCCDHDDSGLKVKDLIKLNCDLGAIGNANPGKNECA